MTQAKDMNEIFDTAFASALITGVGVIKITNTTSGMKMEAVASDKFLELSDELKWIEQNMFKVNTNERSN